MTENGIKDGIIEDPLAWQGALSRSAPLGAPPDKPVTKKYPPVSMWFSCMVPTYRQHGESCVGHSWANWIEGMVRRWIDPLGIPKDCQIDGQAIWAQGRKMFWNGNMQGGLYIDQGYKAAVALGWLPADSALVKVPQDWNTINKYLAASPMVQGHSLTQAWFNASPESGCIDYSAPKTPKGGHATLLIATLERQDTEGILTRWRVLMNSWGRNRGRYGFFTMKDKTWLDTAIADCPYTARIRDIDAWDGWKGGLIKL